MNQLYVKKISMVWTVDCRVHKQIFHFPDKTYDTAMLPWVWLPVKERTRLWRWSSELIERQFAIAIITRRLRSKDPLCLIQTRTTFRLSNWFTRDGEGPGSWGSCSPLSEKRPAIASSDGNPKIKSLLLIYTSFCSVYNFTDSLFWTQTGCFTSQI